MRGTEGVVCAVMAIVLQAHAKPPIRTSSHAAPVAARAEVRPAPPLPMLPSVARVDIEVARDHVVVIEDVHLPRGDWRSGGLDLYVAFGAPGVPMAMDARVGAGRPDPAADAAADAASPPAPGRAPHPQESDAVSLEPAIRRPPGAQLLLGRPQMAGVVLHVTEAELHRAYATSEVAALSVRSLLAAPAADPRGARDIVVRLGIAGDLPLTLGRVQLRSLETAPWLTRAEATLCGPEAEPWPLALSRGPRMAEATAHGDAGAVAVVAPIAPVMAVRHASDDLCVRWWAEP